MVFKPKSCLECGKEFIPRNGQQKYCDGPHITQCVICGKDVEYTCSPREKPKCCSKECSKEMKRRTVQSRYGVDNVAQAAGMGEKISAANTEEVKEKRRKTTLEKYGVENVAQSDIAKLHTKSTFLEKYGVDNVMKTVEMRERSRKIGKLNANNPEIVKRRKETMVKNYGVEYSIQTFKAFKNSVHSRRVKPTDIEQRFVDVCNKFKIWYEREYCVEGPNHIYHSFDFYLKQYNILVDVDGIYWHDNMEEWHTTQNRHAKRLDEQRILCVPKGMKFFVIHEENFDKDLETVLQYILNY